MCEELGCPRLYSPKMLTAVLEPGAECEGIDQPHTNVDTVKYLFHFLFLLDIGRYWRELADKVTNNSIHPGIRCHQI